MKFYVKSNVKYVYWSSKDDEWIPIELEFEDIIEINYYIDDVNDITSEIEMLTMEENDDKNWNNYKDFKVDIKILTRVD